MNRFAKGIIRFLALILGIFSIIVVTGCKKKTVGELIHELRDDKFVREVERGHHKMTFRYVPEELYHLTRGGVDTNRIYEKNILDSLKGESGQQYGLTFLLTLAPKVDTLSPTDFRNDVIYGQLSGQGDYRKTLNEYLFGLKTKIWLEVGDKRIDMKNYHMSRSWGMTKSRTFTLLFGTPDELGLKSNPEINLVVESIVPGQGRDKIAFKI